MQYKRNTPMLFLSILAALCFIQNVVVVDAAIDINCNCYHGPCVSRNELRRLEHEPASLDEIENESTNYSDHELVDSDSYFTPVPNLFKDYRRSLQFVDACDKGGFPKSTNYISCGGSSDRVRKWCCFVCPTAQPTKAPTKKPTPFPTKSPTPQPTNFPTKSPAWFDPSLGVETNCANAPQVDISNIGSVALHLVSCPKGNLSVPELKEMTRCASAHSTVNPASKHALYYGTMAWRCMTMGMDPAVYREAGSRAQLVTVAILIHDMLESLTSSFANDLLSAASYYISTMERLEELCSAMCPCGYYKAPGTPANTCQPISNGIQETEIYRAQSVCAVMTGSNNLENLRKPHNALGRALACARSSMTYGSESPNTPVALPFPEQGKRDLVKATYDIAQYIINDFDTVIAGQNRQEIVAHLKPILQRAQRFMSVLATPIVSTRLVPPFTYTFLKSALAKAQLGKIQAVTTELRTLNSDLTQVRAKLLGNNVAALKAEVDRMFQNGLLTVHEADAKRQILQVERSIESLEESIENEYNRALFSESERGIVDEQIEQLKVRIIAAHREVLEAKKALEEAQQANAMWRTITNVVKTGIQVAGLVSGTSLAAGDVASLNWGLFVETFSDLQMFVTNCEQGTECPWKEDEFEHLDYAQLESKAKEFSEKLEKSSLVAREIDDKISALNTEMQTLRSNSPYMKTEDLQSILNSISSSMGVLGTSLKKTMLTLQFIDTINTVPGVPSQLVNQYIVPFLDSDIIDTPTAVWDYMQLQLLQVVNKLGICPKPTESFRRRLSDSVTSMDQLGAMRTRSKEGSSLFLESPQELRRALGKKGSTAEEEEVLAQKLQTVSVLCDDFRISLKRYTLWGKSTHESLLNIVEMLRKKRVLEFNKVGHEEAVMVMEGSKAKLEEFRADYANQASLSNGYVLELLHSNEALRTASMLRLQDISDTWVENILDLCGAVVYVDPSVHASDEVCKRWRQSVQVRDAQAAYGDLQHLQEKYETFLAEAHVAGRVPISQKHRMLDVTKYVDMDELRSRQQTQFEIPAAALLNTDFACYRNIEIDSAGVILGGVHPGDRPGEGRVNIELRALPPFKKQPLRTTDTVEYSMAETSYSFYYSVDNRCDSHQGFGMCNDAVHICPQSGTTLYDEYTWPPLLSTFELVIRDMSPARLQDLNSVKFIFTGVAVLDDTCTLPDNVDEPEKCKWEPTPAPTWAPTTEDEAIGPDTELFGRWNRLDESEITPTILATIGGSAGMAAALGAIVVYRKRQMQQQQQFEVSEALAVHDLESHGEDVPTALEAVNPLWVKVDETDSKFVE